MSGIYRNSFGDSGGMPDMGDLFSEVEPGDKVSLTGYPRSTRVDAVADES